MKKRILFVDDESMILDGMRRMLRGMRDEWDMEFRASGPEALEVLTGQPFDVVVADMKMPGMDGAALLAEVKRRYPSTIRIVLSGHSAKESVLKSVGVTHQYLAKPCDPERLKDTIARTVALNRLLGNESLRGLITQMSSLPSLPTLFHEIVRKLQDPNASLEDIGSVIRKDIGMSARVLQLVNSAYFGLPHRMTSVERGVAYLGLETIAALVLSVDVFTQFEGPLVPRFAPERLWDHSMRTAILAKAIAGSEGLDKQAVDDTFTAGMLHDVGLLVLAARLPDQLTAVLDARWESGGDVLAVETQIMGVTHAEIGAYLLGLWGLPVPIVEAVAFHYSPAVVGQSTLHTLGIVHVADALSSEAIRRDPRSRELWDVSLDRHYLETIGVAHRLPEWTTIAAGIAAAKGN